MSNSTTFSNDTAWKAFKYSVKFVWWCIKAMFKVLGFLFIGYKKYKEHKARKAAERAAEAAAAREQMTPPAAATPDAAPAADCAATPGPSKNPDAANVKPE